MKGEKPASSTCNHCGRKFFGPKCLTNHLLYTSTGQTADHNEKKNVCSTHRLCPDCGRTVHSSQHNCGESECPSCKKVCNLQQHKCFIQPVPTEEKRKKKPQRHGAAAGLATLQANEEDNEIQVPELHPVYVFFDIEARQDTGNHIANLLCAETNENDRQFTFRGESCIEDFLEWIFKIANRDEVETVIAVAHNFKGYDGYMVLEELYKQHATNLYHVVNGAKILSIKLPKVKFIDSMNFFPMALANFPKTFGLTQLKKGFFPHFFNTKENQHYVGYMPDVEHYDPDGMSPAGKREFLAWHAEKVRERYIFRFQDELLTYCQSDVRLLKQGCMTFQDQFKSIVGIDPMRLSITIASACNVAYRRNWMPTDKIAVEPLQGWRPSNTQSHAALEWLKWEESQLNHDELTPRIAHAGNRGEVRIRHGAFDNHLVDGYDEQTKTIYEFEGCFWHGCLSCFPNRMQKHPRHLGKTMHEVREQTQQKVNRLKSLGYQVIEMWECQWNELKKNDEEIKNFASNLQLITPLLPRDAFFGGRTNAVCLHQKIQDGEEIWYVDITSLYPSVNKTCVYPVGHPQFIDHPDQDNPQSRYFGLIKCKVLPPYGLYHPVLPYRQGNKLTFPLCRSCVEQEPNKPLRERSRSCPHSSEQRALTGTWCTPELQKAVEKGYTILYVYEVWHFPHSSTDLFRRYVDTFLKLKQEASGWPEGCDTPVKREAYIRNYLLHEGICLNPANIESNPGLRSLAKLMLNSFWGKFGQRSNQTQVKTCTQPHEFFDLIQDDSRLIHRIEIANEKMVEVFHSSQNDCDQVQTNVNIFIAAFTTCWARLRLYDTLDMLGERVLYFDTDSVVYHWKPGQMHVPTGNYLGEFTSELAEGDYITEFVAAGPKNYAYLTQQGKQCCKVRGFTLNTRGQEVLNFSSMKDLVLAEILDPEDEARTLTLTNPHKIQRIASNHSIKTVKQAKQYKLVFDKRVLDTETFKSYPYGYGKVENK